MADQLTRRERVMRWLPRRWWLLYLLLLANSVAWESRHEPLARWYDDLLPHEPSLNSPLMDDRGPVTEPVLNSLAYRVWPLQAGALGLDAVAKRVPVILLHGSPGEASDFARLAPALRDVGYRVIAFDLPGFGQSWTYPMRPRMSALAHARTVLAAMDLMHIERAHVVGWSLGGAVALHMADLAPERIASLTLMASVSEQATEESGSYFFEHVKYAAGWGMATAVRYGVPHFGLLSHLDMVRASMRNFWDTDMRPLRGIMQRLKTPTLIIHGRHDCLVPDWAAVRSHELIGPSRLVMLDASHFLPFLQVDEGTAHLTRFFARHEEPGVVALRQVADLAPEGRHLFGAAGARGEVMVRRVPWWVLMLIVAGGVVWRQRLAALAAALCVSFGILDLGVAVAGIVVGLAVVSCAAWWRGVAKSRRGEDVRVIGRGLHARSPRIWGSVLERPVMWGLGSRFVPGEQEAACEAAGYLGEVRVRLWFSAALSWLVWGLLYTVPVLIGAMFVAHPLAERFGEVGLLIGAVLAWLIARVLELVLTRMGRRALRMKWARATRREYWPTAVLYAPLLPRILRMGAKHGLTAFTCCNPGIGGGGGMIGESKREILEAMDGSPHVLPAEFIAAGPASEERARHAAKAVKERHELGGYPVILKPDAGQRGFAVKVARNERDLQAYFKEVTTPVLVQRFHPGPHECGVLWMRNRAVEAADARGGNPRDAAGYIYSITRKEFPVLVGDGKRTMEELIWRHPRFRNQAAAFLERFADERDRVPAAGEGVRLAQSGNHCQGTLFRDGEDLVTPELSREVDRIAREFKGGLDMARLDVRYESEEALKRGTGFGIVELNGTAGESTNIYDPGRSIAWCYRVLGRQCVLAYELGAARKRAGAKGMSLRELIGAVRKQARERRGPEIAD